MKDNIARIISTGLYSGYLRPFPGTWGTIPAWLIAYYLIGGEQMILVAVTIATFAASVWTSGAAEKMFGHDARKIVIDEWAGMFVTVLFVPCSLTNYALGFAAFRFFDVVKIPPARQFERLPGGWGVTMDDIAAGIQANLTIQIVVYLANRFS